jgi:hypothetical protein
MPEEPALHIPPTLLERLPRDLKERIPADWAAARAERSRAAVDWRWAANPTGDEDLSPLEVQRRGYRPGRQRKLPAPEGRDLSVYGYDADGRAVIVTDRDGLGKDSVHTLLWQGGEQSLRLRAKAARVGWPPEDPLPDFPPRLWNVSRSRNDGGRPVLVESFGEHGQSVERCRWEGHRLAEVEFERQEGGGWALSHRDVLAWEGSALVRIERHWQDGEVEVKFERLPPGATLDRLLGEIEDDLVERISAAAEALGSREPLCALALGYCDGERSLPPHLVACPESVRRQLLAEQDDDFWYRWQAAEWMSAAEVPELTDYGGSEFNARCERVDRQVRLAGDERATGRLLQAVARRLNEVEWRDRLDVTDDFRVYPWEIHGESLEDDLAASGPASET